MLANSYTPPHRISSTHADARREVISVVTGAAVCLLPLHNPAEARKMEGSVLANKLAKGFRGPQSVYSPSSSFYYPALLPQSMLLNTLPLKYDLIGQLQNLLESFLNLANINSDPLIEKQVKNRESLLWRNLRINAQRAAGMFLYNMVDLDPLSAEQEYTSSPRIDPVVRAVRKQYSKSYIDSMQKNVLQLVNASINSLVPDSLYYMRMALNDLCNVAYMLLPVDYDGLVVLNNTQPVLEAVTPQMTVIPSLIGRATVDIMFQRAGGKFKKSALVAKDFPDNTARVRIVLDGINAPLAAGSFVDLAEKRFYSAAKVREDKFEYLSSATNRVLLGSSSSTYNEAQTQTKRRVPLEVLREGGEKSRRVATGAARNSAVFTKSRPVKSFATLGAIGMNHEIGDPNGGTADFFFVRPDRSLSVQERYTSPSVRRLDARYTLFAYCVDGIDILEQLRAGDKIVGMKLIDGCFSIQTGNDVEYSGDVLNSNINM